MRVVVTFGSRAGQVVDLPVPAARAMLADGRALALPADGGAPVAAVAAPDVRHDRMATVAVQMPRSRRGRKP